MFSSKSIDVAPKNGESRLRVMPKLKSSHEFDGVRFPPAPRDLVLHLVFGQNAFFINMTRNTRSSSRLRLSLRRPCYKNTSKI